MAAAAPTPREKLVPKEEDFAAFIKTCDEDGDFEVVGDYEDYKLMRKYVADSPICIIKLRTKKMFADLAPETLYDVLHDPVYRKSWDGNMLEGSLVEQINESTEVGYYAAKMPWPLSNRDFCNMRTWKALPDCWVIFNNSVVHPGCPEESGFVRGESIRTGYLIRKRPEGGVTLTYYTQSDPKGSIPTSILNWTMTKLAPNMLGKIHEVTLKYVEWKAKPENRPEWKPWVTGCSLTDEPYQRHVVKK